MDLAASDPSGAKKDGICSIPNNVAIGEFAKYCFCNNVTKIYAAHDVRPVVSNNLMTKISLEDSGEPSSLVNPTHKRIIAQLARLNPHKPFTSQLYTIAGCITKTKNTNAINERQVKPFPMPVTFLDPSILAIVF